MELPEQLRAHGRPIEALMYRTLEAMAVDGAAAISVAELGRLCLGASPATVRRCLARLQELGAVEILEQTAAADGGRLPNIYRLPLARPRPRTVSAETQASASPPPPPVPTPRPNVPDGPPARPAPAKSASRGPASQPAPSVSGELFPELLTGAPALRKGRPRSSMKYTAVAPGFEQFYAVWPRKVARQEAEKAWDQTVEHRPALAELLEAARRYAAEVSGRDPEKILHPATWLRAHRWNDEIPTRNGNRPGRQQPRRPAPDGLTDDRRAALASVGKEWNTEE